MTYQFCETINVAREKIANISRYQKDNDCYHFASLADAVLTEAENEANAIMSTARLNMLSKLRDATVDAFKDPYNTDRINAFKEIADDVCGNSFPRKHLAVKVGAFLSALITAAIVIAAVALAISLNPVFIFLLCAIPFSSTATIACETERVNINSERSALKCGDQLIGKCTLFRRVLDGETVNIGSVMVKKIQLKP